VIDTHARFTAIDTHARFTAILARVEPRSPKKKNAAAVALGKLSLSSRTPAERAEFSRKGLASRWASYREAKYREAKLAATP
jgi:hypothetical protein